MKLLWTENAKKDLLSIRYYIARNNPANAGQWIKRLRTRAKNIVHPPCSFRNVPEYNQDDIREVLEGNYRIVFQIIAESIIILTIFEGHRLFSLKSMKRNQ